MASQVVRYIVVGAVALVVGASASLLFTKAADNRRYDKLAADLKASQQLATSISGRLETVSGQLSASRNELSKLQTSYNEAIAKLSAVSSGVGKVANGLKDSGTSIESVISGIETAKQLVKALP